MQRDCGYNFLTTSRWAPNDPERLKLPPSPPGLLQVYPLLKLGIAGVFFLCLGIYLITSPSLRSDPNRVSADEVVLGLVGILVGVGILLFGFASIFGFFRRK